MTKSNYLSWLKIPVMEDSRWNDHGVIPVTEFTEILP